MAPRIRDQLFSTVSSREVTPEGYLKVKLGVTCTGVQIYLGEELADFFPGIDTSKSYGVYRSPETVFNEATLKSLALKPITYGHPLGDVNIDNYSNHAIGHVGEDTFEIHGALCTTAIITDPRAIQQIESGEDQISLGYNAEGIEEAEGTLQDGSRYSFKFVGPLIINHVALVETGKCGSSARILDSTYKVNSMAEKKLAPIKDLDMGALVDKIAEQIMPDIQKLITSDDFQNKLVAIVGNSLMGSLNGGDDPDDMDLEEPDTEVSDDDTLLTSDEEVDVPDTMEDEDSSKDDGSPLKDSVKKIRARLNKEVHKRVMLLDKAKTINPDFKASNKSSLSILKDALRPALGSVVDAKPKAYLEAYMDVLIEKRGLASTAFSDANKYSSQSFNSLTEGLSFMEMKNMLKKGGNA